MRNHRTIEPSNHRTGLSIVFLGTPRLAQIVLENLISSPFKPSLVITGQDQKHGRGQALKASLVKLEAQKCNIATSYELSSIDKSFDLAILVAFGQIIPSEVLNKPKHGFINAHPSLLPKYRGPSPIQSAILASDKKTGSTIIKLDEEVDHGPILAQQEIDIDENDTHESLVEKLGLIGSSLLIEVLPNYLSGEIKPVEQNHKQATFTQKIEKDDGKIDLQNPPTKEKLDKMIRAFFPWPTVWTELETKNPSIILRVNNKRTTKKLRVKFLPPTIPLSNHPTDLYLVQPEGKRPMTVKEFLNGYPEFRETLEKIF